MDFSIGGPVFTVCGQSCGHWGRACVPPGPCDSIGQSGAPYGQPLELDLTYKADDAQPASA